jgi:hypothetical protein
MMAHCDQDYQEMTDNQQNLRAERPELRDTGAWLLAAGGLAAAFGAASYRLTLLIAAIVCLAASGWAFYWRRRVAACTPGVACRRPAVTTIVMGVLSLGAVLVVLGFMYA